MRSYCPVLPFSCGAALVRCTDLRWLSIITRYMFGDGFLVSPVTDMGARNKTTYLPAGATYRHYFSNKTYNGG